MRPDPRGALTGQLSGTRSFSARQKKVTKEPTRTEKLVLAGSSDVNG